MAIDVKEMRSTPTREVTVFDTNGEPTVTLRMTPGSARRGEVEAIAVDRKLGVITSEDLRKAADAIDEFGKDPG